MYPKLYTLNTVLARLKITRFKNSPVDCVNNNMLL